MICAWSSDEDRAAWPCIIAKTALKMIDWQALRTHALSPLTVKRKKKEKKKEQKERKEERKKGRLMPCVEEGWP